MGKKSGKVGPDPGEGGAPVKDINVDVMRRAASIGCTGEEIAALLGVHRATFYERLKQEPELQTAIDEARETGRSTLRRLQWQRATAGSDTMLIWLGKQMLGQRDKQELTDENGNPLKIPLRVVVELVGVAAPTIDHIAPPQEDHERIEGAVRKHIQLVG